METITVKNKKSSRVKSSKNKMSETMITVSESTDLDAHGKSKKVSELHKNYNDRPGVVSTSQTTVAASHCDDISKSDMTINSATTTSSSYESQMQKTEFTNVDRLDSATKKPIIKSVPVDVIDMQRSASGKALFSTSKSSTSSYQTQKMTDTMTTSAASEFYEVMQESLSSKQSHADTVHSNEATEISTVTSSSTTALSNSQQQQLVDNFAIKNNETYIRNHKKAAPAENVQLSQHTNVGATTIAASTKSKSSHETIKKSQLNQQQANEKTTKNVNSHDNIKTNKNTTKKTATISSENKSNKTQHEEKTTQSTAEITTTKSEFYDTKTKTWSAFTDQTTLLKNRAKPTLVRYVSKEPNGNCRVIYKKKVFDQRSNKWKIVDEKIVDSSCTDAVYPEIVDDVINTTKTTYTTKLYNTKLGKWEVVDEKSYVDAQAYVPQDIAYEIEKDNTDVANITTTSEVTKVITM